jgi:hypothetical protein
MSHSLCVMWGCDDEVKMTVPMVVHKVGTVRRKHNITPFSGGTPTFQVFEQLHNLYPRSCNILIISLVNPLQCVSLLQPTNALVLLHLPCSDAVLQLSQLLLQPVKVILMPLILLRVDGTFGLT